MTVAVITPPEPIVTVDEVRRSLGLTDTSNDVTLAVLIEAATAVLDGPAGWLGRALGEQTLELRHSGMFWRCSPEITLYYPPLIAVESVTYQDSDGQWQTVDPLTYVAIGGSGATGLARLAPLHGHAWPAAAYGEEKIKIRYRAGWPRAGELSTVPAPIRQAVILGTRKLYDANRDLFLKREEVDGVLTREWVVSQVGGEVIDKAIGALLAPYRVFFG